ncbi:MAG TPA: hypothetical protein VFY13_04865 [Luteolibacter sp.]|nr:hypothetical protein [Luteolibacter sp.]
MTSKPTIRVMAVLSAFALVCACRSHPPSTGQLRTAEGILQHFPSNVQSAEAWYGHPFMVDGTPVQPSEAVTEAVLLKFVGQRVRVSGPWNPGQVWKPSAEQWVAPMPCDPDDDIVDIVNDGIMPLHIEALEK